MNLLNCFSNQRMMYKMISWIQYLHRDLHLIVKQALIYSKKDYSIHCNVALVNKHGIITKDDPKNIHFCYMSYYSKSIQVSRLAFFIYLLLIVSSCK